MRITIEMRVCTSLIGHLFKLTHIKFNSARCKPEIILGNNIETTQLSRPQFNNLHKLRTAVQY